MAGGRTISQKAQCDALREEMLSKGLSYEEIADEMSRRYGFRPREAYRHAYGWTLKVTAERFNLTAATAGTDPDGRATMTAARLCEYEKWPHGSNRRPSVYVLTLLASVYDTPVRRLLDIEDHRRLPEEDRLVLSRQSDPHPGEQRPKLPASQKISAEEPRSRVAVAESRNLPDQGARATGSGEKAYLSESATRLPPGAGQDTSTVVLAPPVEPGMVRRADELDTLISALVDAAASDTNKSVAVCGPGGFGKTTLAAQTSHDSRIRDLFPEILWVETGEQCNPARIVQLVSDLCVHLEGARPVLADPEQAGFHLARVLGGRRALIVIDNVWSAADLTPFLLGGAGCVRLITTRNVRVCPPQAALMRLGPMSPDQIEELLRRSVSTLERREAARLANLCSGWPLLATVVGSSVGQDVAAGASAGQAVSEAGRVLRTLGPQAFDVWDADQRRNAIGQAILSSLSSLEGHVSVGGGSALRERYLTLAIFPPATPIPLSVLSFWWQQAYDWSHGAVRQFCRVLADRSLIDAYLADRDAILLHDVFRSYLRHLVGEGWSELHRSLLDAYRPTTDGRWSDLPREHEYMWRHLSYHMQESGLQEEMADLLAAPAYIVKKAARFGHESLVADRTAIEAAAALGADDHPSHRTWRIASVLTGNGYLLHDLKANPDIASTLQASLMRATDAPEVVEQLRSMSRESGEEFDIRWATTGTHSTADEIDDGHVGAVTGVATHGSLVASCGEDGTVRVWELATRRQVRRYRGHTGWVFATAISPDGEVIASAGDDGMIRLWHRHTGEPVGVLVAHTRRVRGLAFGTGGKLLVSGGEDGQVCLWDTNRPGLVRTMSTPGCAVWSVSVGCSDSLVAASGEDEFVRLYDLQTGELLDEKAAHDDWVRSVAFARAAPLLASGSSDHTVRVWSVADRRLTPIRRTDLRPTRVRCVAFSGHADRVLAAGEDATLRAITAEGPADEQRMPPSVDWIRALALTSDGTVVAGCEDGGLRMWTGRTTDSPAVLASGSNTIWSAEFAEDGRIALLGRGDGAIEIRDAASSDVLRTLPAGHGRVWSLASGADHVAAACGDGSVRLWSLRDADRTLVLNEREQRTWAVAVNHAGTRVAASSGGGIVRVWELPSGRMLWERSAHTGRIRSMAFNDSADLLVTGGGEGTVRVWDVSSNTQVGEFANLSGWVRTVTLDGPGTRVAVGCGPGDIYIGDLAEDKIVAHLFGHSGRLLMLGFSSNPDRLVSAAADGTVRSWSLAHQRQLAEVRVDASLQCGAFDRESSSVLVGSAAGVVAMTVGDHM